ncbi:MAG TPA: ATP-binding cassette domain-containing protein [Ramlibacter sp.]
MRSVTLSVAGQGCTVLLGPSGTGKSTLLRTLAGFNRALPQLRTWGSAMHAGSDCAAGNQPALVMQNSRLLVANVLENLMCMLPERASLTRAMQVEAVRPLLAACGQESLLQMLHQQVVELPLGTQRIVAILREAIAAPRLLMIDEPTSGLSDAEARQVLEVIDAVSARTAVLVVLRNLLQARQVARHVVLLSGGVVQEAQPAPRFFSAPASESGRLLLGSGSCPEPGAGQESGDGDAAAAASAPQRTPPWAAPRFVNAPSAARGPRGFVWLLPGQLAGTPWPGIVHAAAYDLEALRAVGVTDLVSLTEEPFDPALAARFGLSCIASPMPDMHPPTTPQAITLCRSVEGLLARGRVVAVHCHAGLGRTGTVLAAYWLWLGRGRLSAVRALEDVRRLEPGWVQSEAQLRFLQEFALVVADTPGLSRTPHDPEAVFDVAAPLSP